MEGALSLDTRWENIDTLLTRSARTQDETLALAGREIADARFKFPSAEYASYRTHINVPGVAMGVQIGAGGEEIVPSIVVVERTKTGESALVMTAQVCGVVACWNASMSSKGTWRKPGGRGAKGVW
jgi:hypothetical protein